MDRRKFLWSAGAIGTASTVAGGFGLGTYQKTNARIAGLEKAATSGASAPRASTTRLQSAMRDGLVLGFLPGSSEFLANPATESLIHKSATGLRWSTWDEATARANATSLFKRSTTVNISIGMLNRAEPTFSNMLQSLDIVAHFAIDDAPYFAPFGAWSHRVDAVATRQSTTQGLTFTAEVPDRVALEVNYAMNPMAISGGTRGAGSLYLPVGRDGAAGLATGLYVLAAASPDTGVAPDMGALMFSGDVRAPLVDSSGRRPNFDYLTLALRPAAL